VGSMARSTSALAAVAPALLAILLLTVPGTALALGPLGPAPARLPTPTAPSAAEIPAPLLAPLADRMGFNAALAAGPVVSSPAGGDLTVVLTLWPSSPTFFLPPGPGAPSYTSAEVASQYGETPAQYAALESYFVREGLEITHAWPDRMFLTVAGSASAVGAAFGTSERAGTLGARPVVFPASVPHLPAPFASEVAAVSGLTSSLAPFTLPFTTAPNPSLPVGTDSRPAQGQTSTQLTASAAHLIYGMDALYNYSGSSHLATGVGIVLLLWGDGYAPGDVNQYFSTSYPSEFPTPTVRYYPVDGAPNPSATALQDPSTGPQELTLDIEWAGSAAPGATLDAVYAPDGPASNNYSPTDPTMEDALNTAVSGVPGAKVISMSFGTVDGADTAFQAAFTTSFHEALLKGMTLLAASGDNGGTTSKGCQGNVAPQFPATSPDVLAVGGSAPVLSVNPLGTVTGLDSEPAWNLSGGGYSTSYAAPSWQLVGSARAPIQASGMRGEPDVAGPAADNVFFFGGRTAYGEGTSFASPMWAGLIAEMDAVRGSSLGFVTPHLYSVGAAEGTSGGGLVPITQGGNCLGSAAAGWDTVTGWGSPRALPLFESIAGTYAQVTLSVSPEPVAPGGTLSVSIVATNATSHRALTGLSVFVQLDAVSYTGPCGGVLATATGSTDANGSFGVGLPVPGCFFGTTVSVAVTATGSGYYGSNQTNIAVNLDGLSGLYAALQTYPYNVLGFAAIMAAAVGVGLLLSGRRRRHTAHVPVRRPVAPGSGSPPRSGPGGPPQGAAPTAAANAPSRNLTPAATSGVPTPVAVVAPAPVPTVPAHVADDLGPPGWTPPSARFAGAPVFAAPDVATPADPNSSSAEVGDPGEPAEVSGAGWCETCDAPVPEGATSCPTCGTKIFSPGPA